MNADRNDSGVIQAILEETAPEEFRAHTLEAMLAGLSGRRRAERRRRWAAGGAAALLMLVAVAWWAERISVSPVNPAPDRIAQGQSVSAVSAPEVVRGTAIRILSDKELFALFPDRPLALVGPANRQRLVFLDERESPSPGE